MRPILQTILDKFLPNYELMFYSGRGMFGKECLGISLKRNDTLGKFFSELLYVVMTKEFEDKLEVIHELQEAFRSMETDSLGMGMVVYFPHTEYYDDEPPQSERGYDSSADSEEGDDSPPSDEYYDLLPVTKK